VGSSSVNPSEHIAMVMYKIWNRSDGLPGVMYNLCAVPALVMYASWNCTEMLHQVAFLVLHNAHYQDVLYSHSLMAEYCTSRYRWVYYIGI
jgi:hypothetical protein